MYKRISLVMLLVFVLILFAFNPKNATPSKLIKAPIRLETATISSAKPYFGIVDDYFDKSGNGYGWYLGYNRKIQATFDPTYDEMYCSIYRELNLPTGDGTIGGTIGKFDFPTTFANSTQTIYDSSIYQSVGTDPGGQFPYVSDFINGYFFGIFNDVDTNIVSTSQPMFTVADATWGYIFSIWSEPKRIKYMYTNAVIPDAWMGTGDVVYDPSTLYYYWSQAWKEGQHSMDETILSCVVGRTMTPADETSWEWTDYKGLRFDANYSPAKASELEEIGDFYFSYAKDNYGNGTGKGVGVALTRNFDQNNPRLSYIYTNDWGGSFDIDSIGCGPNWTTDSGNMFQIPLNTMFDWYGETLTFNDSIGFDLATQQVIYDSATVIMDDPFIAWNISVIATAYDQVHVLIKAFPGSTEYPGVIFPWTDNGFRAGYYMVNGTISGTGVTWEPATLVANFVDNDKGWTTAEDYTGMEWRYSNRNTLSLCNLGFGQLLASWLDKPSERAVQFGYENANNKYCDDGYLIFSSDDGNSWECDAVVEVETGIPEDPVWYLKYAGNSTNTQTIHEEGWTLANTGKIVGNIAYTFAAHQYLDDIANMEPNYLNKPQFLHVWQVWYLTSGIEAEEISLVKDFELSQNYPNPFNPSTSIQFSLQNNSEVKLSVFNTKGELVSNLKDEKMAKGLHSVNFDASSLNSGIYFYTLKVNGKSESKKMILVK